MCMQKLTIRNRPDRPVLQFCDSPRLPQPVSAKFELCRLAMEGFEPKTRQMRVQAEEKKAEQKPAEQDSNSQARDKEPDMFGPAFMGGWAGVMVGLGAWALTMPAEPQQIIAFAMPGLIWGVAAGMMIASWRNIQH
ncbi:Uncharacterised protein [Candidatus Burarchaeum australiense]|nr:Uncharacterised protein [Candidatus Burarchaeum australiense]